jgi:hypothetical protein
VNEHVYVKNEGKREKHLWNTPMVESLSSDFSSREAAPAPLSGSCYSSQVPHWKVVWRLLVLGFRRSLAK